MKPIYEPNGKAKEYGEKFHSSHEAYSVIKEELCEAKEEIDILEDKLDMEFWRGVRCDSDIICRYNAKIIKEKAINAASECIQIAAMAEKTLRGYEEKE